MWLHVTTEIDPSPPPPVALQRLLSIYVHFLTHCQRSKTVQKPYVIYKGGHPVLYPALRCAPVRSHLQRSHARRHEKNAQHRGELNGRLRALNRILGGVEVDLA